MCSTNGKSGRAGQAKGQLPQHPHPPPGHGRGERRVLCSSHSPQVWQFQLDAPPALHQDPQAVL